MTTRSGHSCGARQEKRPETARGQRVGRTRQGRRRMSSIRGDPPFASSATWESRAGNLKGERGRIMGKRGNQVRNRRSRRATSVARGSSRVIIPGDGPPCPTCHRPMQIREHRRITPVYWRSPIISDAGTCARTATVRRNSSCATSSRSRRPLPHAPLVRRCSCSMTPWQNS